MFIDLKWANNEYKKTLDILHLKKKQEGTSCIIWGDKGWAIGEVESKFRIYLKCEFGQNKDTKTTLKIDLKEK